MINQQEFLKLMNSIISVYRDCKIFEENPNLYYDLVKDLETQQLKAILKDILSNEDYFPSPKKFGLYVLKNTNWLFKILFKAKNLKFFPSEFVSYKFLESYQPDILERAIDEIIKNEDEFPTPAKIIRYYHEIIIRDDYIKCPACKLYHTKEHPHYFLAKEFNKLKLKIAYINDEKCIEQLNELYNKADKTFKNFIENYVKEKNLTFKE